MGLFTPLTGRVKIRRFLAFDLEAKDGESQRAGFTRPFLAGVYCGWGERELLSLTDEQRERYRKRWGEQRYWAFRTKDKTLAAGYGSEAYWHEGGCIDRAMRLMLSSEFSGSYIYAHNGGRFDFEFLLPWLEGPGRELGYRWSVTPVQSSIQLLRITKGRESWSFIDSIKLIDLRLDKAGETFGLGRKLDHDLDLFEWDPRWNEYLFRDCELLYKVLEKFHRMIEDDLGGEVGITAAATSMKTYRRAFLPEIVPSRLKKRRGDLVRVYSGLERSEKTHEFVRAGYVGGRVERYVTRASGLRYYDRNSSYPASMLYPMPAGAHEWHFGTPTARLTESKIGFAEALVEVPEMNLPPLPVRQKDLAEGRLVFPVGRLRGTWEWSELEMAERHGCRIEKVLKSVWYEPVEMFGDFINRLYAYRKPHLESGEPNPLYNPGIAYVAKKMGNSGYGKFAMRAEREKLLAFDDPRLDKTKARPATGRAEDSLIWIQTEQVDACYIMPQVSARITSLARQALYEQMCLCESKGGRVCYVDTDSVITDVELESSELLGGWKEEHAEYGGRLEGEFLAPKLYMLWCEEEFRTTKAKGVDTTGALVVVTERGRGKAARMATEEDVSNARPCPLEDRADELELDDPTLGLCLVRGVRGPAEREVALFDLYKVLSAGGTIRMLRLEKLGALARAGFSRGPRLVTVPRTLRHSSEKREVLPDGTTRPLSVEMW